MPKYYYKVVTEDLKSITHNDKRITYKVGKWITGDNLYVLDSETEAQRLAGKRHFIFKCLVVNPVRLDYFENQFAPHGTYVAPKLMLIDKVRR